MTSRVALVVLCTIVGLSLSLSTQIAQGETTTPAVTGAATSKTDTRLALKNVRSAASRIRRTTLELINDVTQRKMSDEDGDPIFFEPSDKQAEKDPKLYSKEISNWGSMGDIEAPKKSWLDADMKHLEHWVAVLNEDMAAVTTEQQQAAGDSWQQMKTLSQEITDKMTALKTLTQGPKYDNMSIAKAAYSIHEAVQKLEAPWKAAMKSTAGR